MCKVNRQNAQRSQTKISKALPPAAGALQPSAPRSKSSAAENVLATMQTQRIANHRRVEFYWFQHDSSFTSMSLYTLLPFQFRTLSCAATTTTSSSTSTSSQQHKQVRIHRNASQDLHQPPNNSLSTFLNKCIQRSPAVCPEHPKQIALQMAR